MKCNKSNKIWVVGMSVLWLSVERVYFKIFVQVKVRNNLEGSARQYSRLIVVLKNNLLSEMPTMNYFFCSTQLSDAIVFGLNNKNKSSDGSGRGCF